MEVEKPVPVYAPLQDMHIPEDLDLMDEEVML